MTELASLVGAIGGLLAVLGGGVAWLWRRVEKGFEEIKGELERCIEREATVNKTLADRAARSAARDAKQLMVIELLWQVAAKSKAAAPVLARCEKHLEELKAIANDKEGE